MATIAYLDAFSGISGDMTIGAFLDAGMPLGILEFGLDALGVQGYRLEVVGVDVLEGGGAHLPVTRPGHDRARRSVGVGELHVAVEHDDGVGDAVEEPGRQVVRERARRGRRHPTTVCPHGR